MSPVPGLVRDAHPQRRTGRARRLGYATLAASVGLRSLERG